jgi:hypothetical protein
VLGEPVRVRAAAVVQPAVEAGQRVELGLARRVARLACLVRQLAVAPELRAGVDATRVEADGRTAR